MGGFKQKEKELFLKALDSMHSGFDKDFGLIISKNTSTYHTTYKGEDGHRFYDSLLYATALIESMEENNLKRAENILDIVLKAQDTDPKSWTYGVWPWFYEEPLEKMAPPCFNDADFCAKEIIYILKHHSERIATPLVQRMRHALACAIKCIMNRNVGPDYTNIALMGTYVCLAGGNLLGDSEAFGYGTRRLEKIDSYTMEQGNFNEYNSPTYTIIALEELSRMMDDIDDVPCRNIIKKLYTIAWECFAGHFHYYTRQWAGPHARCYSSLQNKMFYSRLWHATDGELLLIPEDKLEIGGSWIRINMKCPDEFLPALTGFSGERVQKNTFYKNFKLGYEQNAYTYLSENYTLGTFNKMDMWNQRRPIIGYFGKGEKVCYITLRCLHDGWDYSSAVLHAVQEKGFAAGAVTFVTNGGDTHCNLDMVKDAKIRAKDFRMRFELGGNIDGISSMGWDEEKKEIVLFSDGVSIKIALPYICFGNYKTHLEYKKMDPMICADLVFYNGEETDIDFGAMKQAICAFTLQFIKSGANGKDALTVEEAEGILHFQARSDGRNMTLKVPVKPTTFDDAYVKSKNS